MGRRALRKLDPALDLSRHFREAAELPPVFDPVALFEQIQPLEVEVGSGKGLFLTAAARSEPRHNFLGIEVAGKYARFAAARLARQQSANALMICGDALVLFRQWLPEASLAAVHVYFPDPWWKKRHHKRRLWTLDFAAQCVRILAPGARLHIATDVGEYYRLIRELLDAQPQLDRLHDEEQAGPPDEGESLTNFERKARARGGEVLRAEYIRRQ